MEVMTRVLLLCCRPPQLSADEAERWLRSQMKELVETRRVACISLTSLESATLAWRRHWDYLIEIEPRALFEPQALLEAPACVALLADLRLLGLQPTVAVARDERTVALLP
jgi:hypothetical protein